MATGFRRLRAPGLRFEKCRGICFCSRSRTGSQFGSARTASEIEEMSDLRLRYKLKRPFLNSTLSCWCPQAPVLGVPGQVFLLSVSDEKPI